MRMIFAIKMARADGGPDFNTLMGACVILYRVER